ncbi:MAG: FAD binding domain-containing protein, partial [bacterium]|nr:FAD binding domain-containing protein [bacterium]
VELCSDGIVIGSAASFSEILKNELINHHFPLLSTAASRVGSVQIRNRATIGGNFVNNAPCADSVPSLLVYDAEIRIRSVEAERAVSLANFLLKPYQTQLRSDEVVTQIRLPFLSEIYLGGFYKLGRRRGVAISRITLAVLMKLVESKIDDIRIASGAVTPIGKRFVSLEQFARGKTVSDHLYRELARMLGNEILDATGLRWSSAYKLPVIQQMFYQQLQHIYQTGN